MTQLKYTKTDKTLPEYNYSFDSVGNITTKQHAHLTGDPCEAYTYDNLSRLTEAHYGISDNNELFTINALGNRDSVNLKTGSNEDYVIDANTNRYTSVGGDNLTYDNAGNLTTDKDGYAYEYDYENRIAKITKDSNDIAEFAYDALGRRIRKIDSIASVTTLYYYSENWQVLSEANDSDVTQRWFVYGNYIDEVLMIHDEVDNKDYYVCSDHLYSPTVLVSSAGGIAERYEYDVYGQVTIFTDCNSDRDWWDGDEVTANTSEAGNPYFFTGRELDILDSAKLDLYNYRTRTMLPAHGRFNQHDQLGINPAGSDYNGFNIRNQYKDGVNLYEYVNSNPLIRVDYYGLFYMVPPPDTSCRCCGGKPKFNGEWKTWRCCGNRKYGEWYKPEAHCCEGCKAAKKVPIWRCKRPISAKTEFKCKRRRSFTPPFTITLLMDQFYQLFKCRCVPKCVPSSLPRRSSGVHLCFARRYKFFFSNH